MDNGEGIGRRRALRRIAGAAFGLSGAPGILRAQAEAITVAVASNFRAPAERLAADFAMQGTPVPRLILGSSGKHAAMILNGGPVDLFLSADAARPARLAAAGLTARVATYAVGRLALWHPGAASGAAALRALEEGHYRALALADARLAPYGTAAEQALAAMGLTAAAAGRRVIGESIGQTFSLIATGNADLGFIALSQRDAVPPGARAGFVPLEAALHAPIRQDAALMRRAGGAAAGFLDKLLSPTGQATIAAYGYDPIP